MKNKYLFNEDLPENKKTSLIDSLLYGCWLSWFMLISFCIAWVASPEIIARSIGFTDFYVQLGIAFIGFTVAVLVLVVLRRSRTTTLIFDQLTRCKPPSLMIIVLVGLIARVVWVLSFPALPMSDGATYVQLAQSLIREGRFEVAGTQAYWPPGYPFFLVPWLFFFTPNVAIPLSQIFLFIVGVFGCYRLAKHLSGPVGGLYAAILFSVWPNLVTNSGVAEKEILIIAVLPWIVYGILLPGLFAKIASGIGIGGATLVQPSLQFLIIAFVVIIPLIHTRRALLGAVLLFIFAAITISPWTIRNQFVFGEFVLISTNGGSNLYRANNPLADGGYTPRGEVDISQLGELAQDREGKKLALEWIKLHPADFLGLMLEKQLRFMGDDSSGVYSTLKRGSQFAENKPTFYIFAKLLLNIWWLIIWLIIAYLAMDSLHEKNKNYRIVVWCWLYLFALHSIFESNGKYHVPMLWVLCVWLGCALAERSKNYK